MDKAECRKAPRLGVRRPRFLVPAKLCAQSNNTPPLWASVSSSRQKSLITCEIHFGPPSDSDDWGKPAMLRGQQV